MQYCRTAALWEKVMAQAVNEAWRYQLDDVYKHQSEYLKGIEFANRWATIIDGEIMIVRGYAWDGCSPAYYLPLIGWIGTPDGERDANGIPQAYYASLVHDVLCQFRTSIPIDKSDTLEIFRELLLKGGFSEKRAEIYVTVVKWLGPQKWLGRHPIPVTPAVAFK